LVHFSPHIKVLIGVVSLEFTTLVRQWAPILVNSSKNQINKNLMCGEKEWHPNYRDFFFIVVIIIAYPLDLIVVLLLHTLSFHWFDF
jgi:hypothetical protein